MNIRNILNKHVYFVSGIDTDAGKSFATGYILKQFIDSGITAISQKFIQTGGTTKNGISLDIEIHRKICGIAPYDIDIDGTTCPVIFSYPASPHLSCKIDDKPIDFDKIKQSTSILKNNYELLLIEGAGGLHVPLNESYTTIDYIKENNLPLLLVTSGKLGSINHTILSIEACKNRGINIEGVLYNNFFEGEDQIINNDTKAYIKDYMKREIPLCAFIEIPVLENCTVWHEYTIIYSSKVSPFANVEAQ